MNTHGIQQFVEALRGEAFEEGVGVPLGAHSVDYLAAFEIRLYHFVHRVDVVLTVAVNAYCDIAHILRFHETRQHGVLMSAVAALGNADVVFVLVGELLDYVPGIVLAAVVYEHHAAVAGNKPFGGKLVYFRKELRCSYRKHLLLIVAGDNNY